MGCFSSKESSEGSKYEVSKSGPSTKENTGHASGGGASSNDKGKKPPTFGFETTHTIIKFLGEGAEGETWLAKDKETGKNVAIKLLKRPIRDMDFGIMERETRIQAFISTGHINIVTALEIIVSHSYLGLVMEYASGGAMVRYIADNMKPGGGLAIDENEARYYFIQLLSAIEHCHKHKVVHRDLKLDNILLDGHEPPRVQLCDFGFANWLSAPNLEMKTMHVGTPDYMAPDVIKSSAPGQGYNGLKADVWSLGVLLYVMLLAQFPFDTANEAVDENDTAGMYNIWAKQTHNCWRDLPGNKNALELFSEPLKDMLDKILEVKADKRISIQGIKAHPWITQKLPQKYAITLAEMKEEQAKLDKVFHPKRIKQDPSKEALLVEIRKKAMAPPGSSRDPVLRLPLTFNAPTASEANSPAASPTGAVEAKIQGGNLSASYEKASKGPPRMAAVDEEKQGSKDVWD